MIEPNQTKPIKNIRIQFDRVYKKKKKDKKEKKPKKTNKPHQKKQLHKNVNMNTKWTWFPYLEAKNNPRLFDKPLISESQNIQQVGF